MNTFILNETNGNHICMVYEYCEMNLKDLMNVYGN